MVLLLGLSLGAVGLQPTTVSAAPVRITHLAFQWHGQPYFDWLNWAKGQFEKENPGIEVKIQVSQGDYFAKLTAMMAAGVAPNVIDYVAMTLDPSLFADLRPYIADTPFANADRMPPAYRLWLTTSHGAVIALPWDLFIHIAYYNSDMLDEAGLLNPYQLGSKWTWDSLIQNSMKITADRNGDGKPDAYGLDRMWAFIPDAIWNGGGNRFDRYVNPTRAQYSDPGVVRGLQWIQDVHNKWKVATPTLGTTDPQFAFWKGNTAYDLVDGPGAMQNLLKVRFHWDVAPQPAGPARDGTTIYLDQVRVVQSAGHVAEAAKWARFLTTNRQVVGRLVAMTGRVPALPGVDYMEYSPKAPAHGAAFAIQANRDNIPPVISPKLDAINKKTQPILDQLLMGTVEPRTAAQMIDDALNAIL